MGRAREAGRPIAEPLAVQPRLQRASDLVTRQHTVPVSVEVVEAAKARPQPVCVAQDHKKFLMFLLQ